MSGSIRLALGVCLGLCVFGAACTKESSEAKSSAPSEAQEVVQAAGDGQVAESGRDSGGARSSAEAYRALINEIETVQRTGSDQAEVVARIEELFKGFIARYPDTDEAADAQINLGAMYMQIGRHDASIAILYEVIDGGTASNEKVGIAHYVLGDAYRASDQFDKAKREYTLVVDRYSFLGQQIVMAAKASLEELDALKRLAIGSTPIPFEVKGTSGEVLSLEKYKGKVVLIDFWATWCAPCRAEMPNVVKLYKKHHDSGFEIIGISLDRSREALDRYVRDNGMRWPQFFDGKFWENEIAMMYKVRAIPATFLIDRRGVLRYRSIRGKQLEEAVDKLVKEAS
jgi:thiol-disulfide isomerase/thioredoxin